VDKAEEMLVPGYKMTERFESALKLELYSVGYGIIGLNCLSA
jgi:hypothetical protein